MVAFYSRGGFYTIGFALATLGAFKGVNLPDISRSRCFPRKCQGQCNKRSRNKYLSRLAYKIPSAAVFVFLSAHLILHLLIIL
jgi:hypothetical protein